METDTTVRSARFSPGGLYSPRRCLAAGQTAGSAVAAAAVYFTDLDNRGWLALLLLVFGAAFLLEGTLDRPWSYKLSPAITPPLGLAAVVLEPRVFVVVILIIAMNTHWAVMRGKRGWLVAVVIVTLIATCVTGALVDAPEWRLITLAAMIVVPTHIAIGVRMNYRHQRSNHNMSQVLHNAAIVVYETTLRGDDGDAPGRFTTLKGPLTELTGWTAEEWEERGPDLIHESDRDAFWIDAADIVDDTMVDRTARFLKKDGEYIWLRDVSRLVISDSGEKRLLGLMADVSNSQLELLRMRRRAHVDALTGVPNRLALLDVLTERLSDNRDGGNRFALLMIDLDKFKDINDSLGHEYGDEALRQVAERLHATMRPGDEIGRLGGDEFGVIAGDVASFEQASAVAERISLACNRPLQLRELSVTASISVGVALSEPGADAQELLRRADHAMYAAKRSGRAHQVFSPRLDEVAGTGLELSAQVPAALSNGEFELHFQPKFDFADNRVCGVEGLARWRHPELGLLPPSDFVHLVEVSDSARFFTDRMLDAGIAFSAELAKAEFDMTVAINVSILTLYDDSFPFRMRAMLERHEVEASSIILEITEQDIMEESRGAPPVLTRLHELGVGVSIDDFGTGYSSLARLQDLPVSEIKIDRRFVTNAHVNNSDRVIVRSIIDLAANLGLRVVAEGVETEAEANMLRDLGCDQGQGFLYGAATVGGDLIIDLRGPELRLIAGDDSDEPTAGPLAGGAS